MEPARVQRCGGVLEKTVRGVCIALLLLETVDEQAEATPRQDKQYRAITLQDLHSGSMLCPDVGRVNAS